MRAFLLFCLALVSSVSALVDVGYHETVGIPNAEKIRAYEQEILRKQSPLERIIGGKKIVDMGKFPFFAGLQITLVNNLTSVCGASLLSANKLVTAAHCWYDGRIQASIFEVVLGSNMIFSGGTRIATKYVFLHPQWNPTTSFSDLAMITLPRNVTFNARIQPISLPRGSELKLTYAGARAVVVGYGKTSDAQKEPSTQASYVILLVISNEACQRTYGIYVFDSSICTSGTGNIGTCYGDSGGPLAIYNKKRLVLIGVTSWGAKNKCENSNTVYARVTSLINFINQHL